MIRTERVDFIKANATGQVLDVGCAESSYFKTGWTGIDIKTGFDINKDDFYFKDFDTIILGEILEHVDNPVKLLNDCYSALRNGGKVVLTTPNCRAWAYSFMTIKNHPEHIFTWDMNILARLIKQRTKFNIVLKDYCGKLSPISFKSMHIVMILQKKE